MILSWTEISGNLFGRPFLYDDDDNAKSKSKARKDQKKQKKHEQQKKDNLTSDGNIHQAENHHRLKLNHPKINHMKKVEFIAQPKTHQNQQNSNRTHQKSHQAPNRKPPIATNTKNLAKNHNNNHHYSSCACNGNCCGINDFGNGSRNSNTGENRYTGRSNFRRKERNN